MRFFTFLENLKITPFAAVVFAVAGAFFAFFIAVALQKMSAFFACGTAFSLLALLGCEVCREFSRDDKKLLRVCLLCLYCMLYVLYLACMRAAEKRRAKKAKFAAMKYREEYVLPERGNGYVRDKLREAALYSRENAANGGATAGGVREQCGINEEENINDGAREANVEAEHAVSLLKKLRKAGLSVSDRLETESLAEKISNLSAKEPLSADEIRELSDCFSQVLKMTAKYVV